MTRTPTGERTPQAIRLWPAVVIAIIQLLVMIGAPIVAPDAGPIGLLGGVAGALAILVWWLVFSRARWIERVGAIVLMVAAVFAARAVAHESIVGAGQGMMIYFLPAPGLALALVAWAVASRHLHGMVRTASLVAAIVLACAPFALMRTAGVKGSSLGEFHLRWTPTPEERLLASVQDEPAPVAVPSPGAAPTVAPAETKAPPAAAPATNEGEGTRPASVMSERAGPGSGLAMSEPSITRADGSTALTVSEPSITRVEWPGFRGPNRDGVVRGIQINPDWTAAPPVQLWRRPIGPGWSSFAVHGDLLYTQEQRGDDEVVTCYALSTGEPVWRHRDPIRFYESNGGAGPRGTPTLGHGLVFTSGATGLLNALDGRTGAVVWSHQVAVETDTATPMWGFSASPLVVDDLVIVAVSGTLAAYDAATGRRRWANPSRGGSYSSPHLATIDGVEQVLLLGGPGVMSVRPADGTLLWEHAWDSGAIVQPAVTTDGDVLINAISMTGGTGIRRLTVAHGPDGWTAAERWTSNGLKPYFNDFVVHRGHAFGFDGSILSSINLEDGKRAWKGGRYGNGQMVLLADQDLLLVISEDGELALVSATTDKFTEIARFPALHGKTWNHPVLVGNTLLVRNGEEMAAFRVPLAGR